MGALLCSFSSLTQTRRSFRACEATRLYVTFGITSFAIISSVS
jgi:hypothetical protein